MNSKELPINEMVQEDAATSSQLPRSDTNANVNSSINQSRGAIPKTKTKSINVTKKSIKLNNNVEDVLVQKNSSVLTENSLRMHAEILRYNGFSDHLSRLSCNYLDGYENSVLYNGTNNSCKNCSGSSNKINGSLGHDIQNSSVELPLYLPSTSNLKEVDIDFQIKLDPDSCSSDDNDLLSISDDGCIYTYKGDHVADLPNSFFSLDVPPPVPSPNVTLQNRQESGSPEMDFLEMDFDPGPSGDADSDSQSNADLETTENLPQDPSSSDAGNHEETVNCTEEPKVTSDVDLNEGSNSPVPPREEPSLQGTRDPSGSAVKTSPLSVVKEKLAKIRMPWSCSLKQRTTSCRNVRVSKRHHSSNGELISPICAHPDEGFKNSLEASLSEEAMIWSEEEASKNQITQIGASACGATAVLNVLNALRFPIPPTDKIQEIVKTRLRSNSSPLAEYLQSRSVAGSTHVDLIEGLHQVSNGQIYARFFHMYPERVLNLNKWLHFWITQGAVPIATLNLQKVSGPIPDAWHHQMIFGVNSNEIYLTNPLECVNASHIWSQLSSESVLLIRREDVLSRWNYNNSLDELIRISNQRWREINVVGQTANLVRESRRERRTGFTYTTHIKIPASYSSGITLAMRKDDPLCTYLMYCPELPLLPSNEEAASGFSDEIFY